MYNTQYVISGYVMLCYIVSYSIIILYHIISYVTMLYCMIV